MNEARRQAPKTPRYRVTVWPRSALPPVELWAWDVELLDGGIVEYGMPSHAVTLDADFHLRELFEVDLDDTQSLVEWVRRWGRVGWPVQVPAHESPTRRAGIDTTTSSRAAVEEIRAHIIVLRAAVRTWIAFQNGSASAEWPGAPGGRLPIGKALAAMQAILNKGLESFSARVLVQHEDDKPHSAGPGDGATLYATVCLLLFNDITSETPYRECANQNCPNPTRLFTGQRGRALKDSHRRSDAIYCSTGCASAVASRNSRARQKAERLKAARRKGRP